MYYCSWIDSDNKLYVKEEFCSNGDLLDYLDKIDNFNSSLLNDEFYWDMIFEMLCVSRNVYYINI